MHCPQTNLTDSKPSLFVERMRRGDLARHFTVNKITVLCKKHYHCWGLAIHIRQVILSLGYWRHAAEQEVMEGMFQANKSCIQKCQASSYLGTDCRFAHHAGHRGQANFRFIQSPLSLLPTTEGWWRWLGVNGAMPTGAKSAKTVVIWEMKT